MYNYGNFSESDGSKGSKFKPGVNDCFLKKFELVTVQSDNYNGKALDLEFEINGEILPTRKFPIVKEKVAALVKLNPDWYFKYVNKEKVLLTVDEVYARDVDKLSNWIRHVVSAYIGVEVYNNAISEWLSSMQGTEITFEMFVSLNKSLLPLHFKLIPAKVVLGYYKNSPYLTVPRAVTDGNFFATELFNDRTLVSPDSKSFKSVKFGDKIEQEPNTVDTVGDDVAPF